MGRVVGRRDRLFIDNRCLLSAYEGYRGQILGAALATGKEEVVHFRPGVVAEKAGVQIQADKEPEHNRFIRSDQYSFIKKGVPSLAFKFGWLPGTPEAKTFKAWYAERYHGPADDLSQPVDVAAAAQFNDILTRLALRVADADQRPSWEADSFFRRFAR